MQVDAFDFDLPRDRIADRPVQPRDSAKLLVVSDGLSDARVCDLPNYLRAGDLIVVNDTRVIPARIQGYRWKAKIQITLDKPLGNGRWRILAYPARKLKPGDTVAFTTDFVFTRDFVFTNNLVFTNDFVFTNELLFTSDFVFPYDLCN